MSSETNSDSARQPIAAVGLVCLRGHDVLLIRRGKAPREGEFVSLICREQTVDDVSGAASTIGYEILTRLGRRFSRNYRRQATLAA